MRIAQVIIVVLAMTRACQGAELVDTFPGNRQMLAWVAEAFATVDTDLNPADVNSFTVTLNDGRSDLRGEVRYQSGERKIVFQPLAPLERGQTYKATISGTIRNIDGTRIGKNLEWIFTVGTDVDYARLAKDALGKYEEKAPLAAEEPAPVVEPFTIVSITPGSQSEEVPVTQVIKVRFSEQLEPAGINKYTVILRTGSEIVTGRLELSENDTAVSFFPLERLFFGARYTLNISNLIASKSGKFLDQTLVTTFKTREKDLSNTLVITRTFPVDGGVEVDPNVKIVVFFNEGVEAETVNRFTVQLKDGEQAVWCNHFLADDRKCLVIQPAEILPVNRDFTVVLKETIRGDSGSCLGEECRISFRTASDIKLVTAPVQGKSSLMEPARPPYEEIDVHSEIRTVKSGKKLVPADAYVLPRLIESFPAPDAEGVPVDAVLHFRFNKPLRKDTVNQFNFLLMNGETPVPGRVEYDDADNLVRFQPECNLEYSRKYFVMIMNGVRDNSDNGLPTIYRYSFKIDPPPDIAPPEVVATSPLNGQIGVAGRPVLSAVFSEKMDESTLNSFTIILNDGEYNIPGNISYNPEKFEVYFKPAKDLPSGQWFTFALTSNIKDGAGNRMEQAVKVRFLVGDPPDKTPPALLSVSPADGAVIPQTRPAISLTFSERIRTGDISPFNLTVKSQEGRFIPGIIEYSSVSNRVVYRLLEELPYGMYTLQCRFVVQDDAGNEALIQKELSFEVAVKDSRLSVFNIFPLYGETVPAGEDLYIDFSNDVNPVSLNPFTVRLMDENGKMVPGVIEYLGSLRKAFFRPEAELKSGEKYSFSVTTSVQDTRGRQLDKDYRVEFYVE
ncbi:MAG: Ig-like domain-containing protein [Candidatus Wallbacteria bacterium]|nr:Ig-like domain-containing protein [Candidatus Wallbacteria bacterium]